MTLTLEAVPLRAPRLCECGKPLKSHSGPGRPVMYCSPECRAKADNQRDRDRRAAERPTFGSFLTRAVRNGWLETRQPPTGLPGDYQTLLNLAVEVVTVHGPAVDRPDDPRLAGFTSGVCRIIQKGITPPEAAVLEADQGKRMRVLAVTDPPEVDQLCRLFEMTDPHRQRGNGSIGRYCMGEHGSVDLTSGVIYSPLGPHPRATQAVPLAPAAQASPETSAGFYDRDPRHPYRAPYLGIAWDHGPEAIAGHIAPALAAYTADAM